MGRYFSSQNVFSAGCFLAAFLPLVVLPGLYYPFILSKALFLRFLVEILVLLAFGLLFWRPNAFPLLKWSPIFLAYGIFLAILTVSTLFSTDSNMSFWSTLTRMEGLVTYLHLGALLFVLSLTLQSERSWLRFFSWSVGVSAITSVWALLQVVGLLSTHQDETRPDALFGNPSFLAIYLLIHIFLTVWIMGKTWFNRRARFFCITALFLELCALYATATRGAMIALAVGTAVSAMFLFWQYRKTLSIRTVVIGVCVAILLFSGTLGIFREKLLENPVIARFHTVFTDAKSGSTRLVLWEIAGAGITDRPLVGRGLEQFGTLFASVPTPGLYASEPWFDRAHNQFLDIAVAAGLFGLLSYLALFATALHALWKSPNFSKSDRIIFSGLITAYLVAHIFLFETLTAALFLVIVLAYLHAQSALSSEFTASDRVRRIALVAGAPVILYFFIAAVVMPFIATVSLDQALSGQDSFEKRLLQFNRAIQFSPASAPEPRQELAFAAAELFGTESVPASVRAAYAAASDQALSQWIDRRPDARAEVVYGSFLRSIGEYEAAAVHLERALELSPHKFLTLGELAATYLELERYPEALTLYEERRQISPKDPDTRLDLAMAAIYAGNTALLHETLLPAYGTIYVPDDRFIRAYFDTGQLGALAKIWRAKVEKEPNVPEHRLALAAVLVRINLFAEASEEIQKAVALNPALKKAGEHYLEQVRDARFRYYGHN